MKEKLKYKGDKSELAVRGDKGRGSSGQSNVWVNAKEYENLNIVL